MLRLLQSAALAAALAPAAAQSETRGGVTDFVLDNGMQIVVVEDHRAPVVQHMLWYRAGSADEPKGSSGVAHFLEHLLFKATDKLEAGELSATVAANGGRDNAFTSHDYTAYFQRIAADRLELMMSMEADRMKNIRLTPENIETERDVIIEERNQRTENDPGALFGEQMSAAQYLNHRYGTPIIGWMHEMRELDLEDALSFYELYYSPNNAILVVSGDVKPDEVRALAEKYYGVIPANPDLPDRLRTEEPPQNAERRVIFRDARVAQPYVSRSYLMPERDSGAQETSAALTILAQILGGGTTSYFAEKLQFDEPVATYSTAYYSSVSLDDTTFRMIVVPSDGVSLQEAEDAMDAALAQFALDGVNPEQLERIKLQIRASEIYAQDNVDGIANRYGRALTSGLTIKDVQDWPGLLDAVTEDEIMEAAKLLRREASVTGWLMKPEAPVQSGETQ
ncbi:peptidase M16 [Sulfitobacter sp. SK012]|uniref:M16 family metallopeptidase n=1 Tax=Sulfitobacter sp. SK012 TaxID=1389005 RepID=UPI000E0C48B6|nr:pitrilysin family protein [Sulfitobacter sp. SK012]AXI48255.1 peptidase M16 [Sulfitobacter sp. SK012]